MFTLFVHSYFGTFCVEIVRTGCYRRRRRRNPAPPPPIPDIRTLRPGRYRLSLSSRKNGGGGGVTPVLRISQQSAVSTAGPLLTALSSEITEIAAQMCVTHLVVGGCSP